MLRPTPPILLAAFLLVPCAASAQAAERYSLPGRDVAIYNLAGTIRVEGGGGDQVVVEMTRVGADAAKLSVASGEVRGRQALRVRYPSDRVVYPQRGYGGRTTMNVYDDDT